MKEEFLIEVYRQDNGKFPFIEWEGRLPAKEKAIISTRLARLRQGNFGDCKSIKGKGAEGLYELRIHFGPGYRIYYGLVGKKIILLLSGGEKSSQERDIFKIKSFWKDYKEG
jgi:putative addiction module killer protein